MSSYRYQASLMCNAVVLYNWTNERPAPQLQTPEGKWIDGTKWTLIPYYHWNRCQSRKGMWWNPNWHLWPRGS